MIQGRPTLYTEEIAAEVCFRLAEGQPLAQICRLNAHIPTIGTVLGWVTANREGFAERYARARAIQIEVMAEEIAEISDDGMNDWMEVEREGTTFVELRPEHINRSRLRVDSRKWLLSKMKPEKYGERVTADINAKITVYDPGKLAHLTDEELMAVHAISAKLQKVEE